MKIRIFIVLLALLSMLSCGDENCCTNIGPSIALCVVDQHGNDLLMPETSGAIDTAAIVIYRVKDGEPIRDYSTGGYSFGDDNINIGKRTIHFGNMFSYVDKDNKSTIIIKWNKQEADTITELIESGRNYSYAVDFWINGSKDIDWINKPALIARIVKQR